MSANATLRRPWLHTLFDAFLLRPAEKRAAEYPRTRLDRGRVLYQAANQRASAADDLLEREILAALPLYREAAVLYMAAALAERSETPLDEPLKADQVVARFGELDLASAPPASEKEWQDFTRSIVVADPLVLDRLPHGEAVNRLQSMRPLIAWLHDLIETRTVRQIRVERVFRLVAAIVVPLALLSWGLYNALQPVNIALHKPVVASSRHPNSTSAPSGLTDGVTGGSYGVHTAVEDAPWVQVDLLDVYRLDQVKIYNRGDGWFDDALPLTLLLSENGTSFTEVDKRTTSFGQWLPWTYKAGGKKARYIRVAGHRGSVVALSELEASGSK